MLLKVGGLGNAHQLTFKQASVRWLLVVLKDKTREEENKQNYRKTDGEITVLPASVLASSCALFLRRIRDDNLEMLLPQQ